MALSRAFLASALASALAPASSAAAARADERVAAPAAYPPPPPFLSNALGSHMVLQRDAPALVYGFAPPGTNVFTNMTQAGSGVSYALQTQATGDGLWRQLLPAQAASRVDGADAWAFSFTSDAGDGAQMDDVLFGDVHVCAGQSNMQFTLTLGANSSAECAAAGLAAYAGMRVMSIYDNRSATPREYIYPEYLLPWSVASEDSICPGGWGYMSAVCWYTYRGVYEALGVPMGLISNSFGGSRIEEWSSPEALDACPAIVPPPPGQNLYASAIWNVMMTPFTVGPMGMRTALFYQGGEQKEERARARARSLARAHAASSTASPMSDLLPAPFTPMQRPILPTASRQRRPRGTSARRRR